MERLRRLVCFAVPEEATPWLAHLRRNRPVTVQPSLPGTVRSCRWYSVGPGQAVLVTGMGPANAELAFRAVLSHFQPEEVITAGFAGGLNPAWPTGTVIYDAADHPQLATVLATTGAQAGKLVCVDRIAVTVAAKEALFRQTGADAVEMESGVLRACARSLGLPAATVRVVSDAADEALPLDFSQLVDDRQELRPALLAAALLRHPASIPRLVAFRGRIVKAASRLTEVLAAV